MKPASIADYLDHIASGESAFSRREASPFRPRRPPTLQTLEQRTPASVARAAAVGALKPEASEYARRPVWGPEPSTQRERGAAPDANSRDFALRTEEARARGREEGIAIGRDEAEKRFVSERASLREQALVDRLDFQLNEYAQLEAAIRAGITEIEARVGEAVARILKPFLADEIVKSAVDQLMEGIARLSAGPEAGLIKIRGPARVLSRLRDQVADLPLKIDLVEDGAVEETVECNATRIFTELEPWADFLGSFEA